MAIFWIWTVFNSFFNISNTYQFFLFNYIDSLNSKRLILFPLIILAVFVFIFPANAKYASFIINENTKRIYHNTNADTLNYPASLTKIMTLYMIFDALESKKISMNTK